MHRNKSLQAALLILSILAVGLIIGCISRMEETKIEDYGQQQIGENLYLKKLVLNSDDRVYILVDKDGMLVSPTTSTNYTVKSGKATKTEANMFIH